jgi:molybdate transport system substrate-binding protein
MFRIIVENALPSKARPQYDQVVSTSPWRDRAATKSRAKSGPSIRGSAMNGSAVRKQVVAMTIGFFVALGASADAAEVKALVSTAMKRPFEELSAQFERSAGHKVVASFGPSGALTKRLSDGEAADLVILGGGGLESLIKQGKVAGGGVDVARSMIGVAVAKGAPQPDISTPEKFKAVLLAARSVAYTDPASGGASGAYLGKLFDKMGLTEVLKPKAKLAAGGPNGYAGTFVARGDAEIAMQPIPELMAVPGLDIVGPLPGEFQNVTTYAAGIPVSAGQTVAARALIEFLSAPAAASVYKTHGLEPG